MVFPKSQILSRLSGQLQHVASVQALLAISVAFVFLFAFRFYFYNYTPYKGEGDELFYLPHQADDIKSYLIRTPGCSIPRFDPFDPSVKRFYVKTTYTYKCSDKKSVFQILPNGGVSLIESELQSQYNVRKNETDCYFYPIQRKTDERKPDDHFVVGKKHDLIFNLPIDEDYIVIKCYHRNVSFLRDIIALTPIKPDVERKCLQLESNQKASHEKLNVLIVGIDSVSKLNFLRYFHRSLAFLRQNLSAFEFRGYNKVGDNTYPNLVPLLTGHKRNFYNGKEKGFKFFDDAAFVWKEFAKLGYRTLYSEDAPKIGTFVLNRRGFKNPPTDYYTRPFALSVESSSLRNNNFCIGSKLEVEVYFDYLKRFTQAMGDRPFFSFMFMARLTHDLLKRAGYADKPSFELLRDLHESGTLNRSLLVFFSDHGIRFGDIRKTYVGKIEERMPFAFLVLPKWFLKKHRSLATNLKINEARLTTPYDIHATLLHLLRLDAEPAFSTELGRSLFGQIPQSRTCSQAAIAPHWCACHVRASVSVEDANVKSAAAATIRKLNDMLKPYEDLCVPLELREILDARVSRPSDEFLGKKDEADFSSDYLVTVTVAPSAAVFEATVRLRKGQLLVSEEVSRINRYSNQSHCIDDSIARLYCLCRDMVGVA